MKQKISTAALVISCVVLLTLSVFVAWHPIISTLIDGGSLNDSIKDYFLGDQLTYTSISQNVAAGHGSHNAPLTLTGHSIYPSGYYYLLGLFAHWTHTPVFFAANVIGITRTACLVIAGALIGKTLSNNRWG